MRIRNFKGAGMALVIGAATIVVMFGVAIFWFVQMFGAGTEVRDAVDAGSLAVAKQASQTPTVQLPACSDKYVKAALAELIDKQTKGVDLYTYNRFVGQALLVALNAQADYQINPTSKAIDNARAVVNYVQGTNGSVGKSLSDALCKSDWVRKYFDPAATRNPTAMADKSKIIAWRSDDYQVGYLGQDLGDRGSTNIKIDDIDDQRPYCDYENDRKVELPLHYKDGTGSFLRGYQPLRIDKVGSIYAVSVSPEQPHLIQPIRLSTQKQQPGKGAVSIPPNSFLNGGEIVHKNSGKNLLALAAATVGTGAFSEPSHPLEIPNGYIIIDNEPCCTYQWPDNWVPCSNNVAAQEFRGNILVDNGSGCFSANGAVERWRDYLRTLASLRGMEFPPPPPPQPSVNGLFTAYGNHATVTDAQGLAWWGPCTACTDENSEEDPVCADHLFVSGAFKGAFDRAYHSGGTYFEQNPCPLQQLTDGEFAKLELVQLFCEGYAKQTWGMAPTARDFSYRVPSGMRLYHGSSPVKGQQTRYGPPWSGTGKYLGGFRQVPGNSYSNPNGPGQVTRDATLAELINQTTENPESCPYERRIGDNAEYVQGRWNDITTPVKVTSTKAAGKRPLDEVTRFLINRIHQIKHDVSDEEINAIFGKVLNLTCRYIIYKNDSGKVVIEFLDPNKLPKTFKDMGGAPSDIKYSPIRHGDTQANDPDGTPIRFSRTYNINGTLLNPPNEFNVHEKLFMSDKIVEEPTETLSVTYWPASGAYNLLGRVDLRSQTHGSAKYYNRN